MPRWERTVLLGCALGYAVVAVGLQPPYVFYPLLGSAPGLWQAIFAAVVGSIVAWVAQPRWKAAYVTSLLTCTLAASSRGIALLLLAEPPAWPAAAGWHVILVLTWYAWPRIWHDTADGRG